MLCKYRAVWACICVTMYLNSLILNIYKYANQLGYLVLPHSAQRKDLSISEPKDGLTSGIKVISEPHRLSFQNIKSGISHQPLIGSSSNFKLKLRVPNQTKNRRRKTLKQISNRFNLIWIQRCKDRISVICNYFILSKTGVSPTFPPN